MKFRKKPVVIEAEQYQEGRQPVPDGVHGLGCSCCPHGVPHVHTLEGELRVRDGDWIITGISGEKYPCKPDIFAETYEPVRDDG